MKKVIKLCGWNKKRTINYEWLNKNSTSISKCKNNTK